jgi:carboxypeptidase C (cathepsin A)
MIVASLLLQAVLLAAHPHDANHGQPAAHVAEAQPKPKDAGPGKEPAVAEEKPVITDHEIAINGRALKYTATAGELPIKNAAGETEAQIFYIAYSAAKQGDAARRPLIFAFNGGPGSSSVWLHLGAMGPMRVKLNDDGSMPPPPFALVENGETWLDEADLVFIDPVGTGFSRAVKPDQASKFYSLNGDIESVGEFIRLYLTRFDRWSSPLFLAGESYGSTRAAGLAGHLIERGIAFNGIVLISTVLNFSTIGFAPGNDLPYSLFIPSYAAAARFHGKIPAAGADDRGRFLEDVARWSMNEYLVALGKGDTLTPQERLAMAQKIAAFTGLDTGFVDNCNLRIEESLFAKELLRDGKRIVGRFDGRLVGIDSFAAGDQPAFDPSLTAVRPPFTAAFNDYVRTALGYRSDREYYVLGGGIGRWDWGAKNSFTETGESLRSAMGKNPAMKLFVASGIYDLATPYMGTEYTLNHLGLAPQQRQNITSLRYEAGHMMYTDARVRAQLKRDVAEFIRKAAGITGR